MWAVINSDALKALKTMEDNQFDSVVTDPPYGLSNTDPGKVTKAITEWVTGNRAYVPDGKGFMGKKWDEFVPPPAAWDEVFRVLKPGGHALVFAGTRTHGLMEISLRLAGFDIRDSIDWIYGSGFPKSRDISKAIDSEAGAEREVIGPAGKSGKLRQSMAGDFAGEYYETNPATEAAKQWEGWGTALKPAHEPIIVARKPLTAKTVAANVLEYGTGAINVDGCRVGNDAITTHSRGNNTAFPKRPGETTVEESGRNQRQDVFDNSAREGRWPPNILLSHSPWCDENGECTDDCPVAEMDRQSGITSSKRSEGKARIRNNGIGLGTVEQRSGAANAPDQYGDTGGASRFFSVFKYNAKASKKERPVVEGLPGHPTVKPVAVMRWLVNLVTQPNGVVLDPFAGTGTTAEACELEGMNCVLIENDPDSIKRINKRMEKYED